VYSLLRHGFAAYEGYLVYGTDKPVSRLAVYKGERDAVDAVVAEPLWVTVAKGSVDKISARTAFDTPIVAPVEAGGRVGTLTLSIRGERVGDYPLVAAESVVAGSW